jgi:hypothetical protein
LKQYATNVYVSGAAYQKNIRVPPNTNPKFNGGDVIEGILYIESPNQVEFRGHATINGVIVFEGTGGPGQNVLDFKGNVSPSLLANSAEFGAIRAAANGWAILAPTASVVMSGSVDGSIEGTIMVHKITLQGSADLTITKGSIVSIGTDATSIEGKTVHIQGTAVENPPSTGLTFSGRFLPNPTTYFEP